METMTDRPSFELLRSRIFRLAIHTATVAIDWNRFGSRVTWNRSKLIQAQNNRPSPQLSSLVTTSLSVILLLRKRHHQPRLCVRVVVPLVRVAFGGCRI
jgi:hypothetical protein